MNCPIGIKMAEREGEYSHCETCHFARNGKCKHEEIMKEHQEKKVASKD